MSRNPYCQKCGVLTDHHSAIYCTRVGDLETRRDFLLKRIRELREELAVCRGIISNTARTVQVFRLFIPIDKK